MERGEGSITKIQNIPKFLPYGSELQFFTFNETPWFSFYADDDKTWVYEWDGTKFDDKMPIMEAAQSIKAINLNNTLYLILSFYDDTAAKIYKWSAVRFFPTSDFQLPSDKDNLDHTFTYNNEQFFVFFNTSGSIPEQGETFEIDRWNGNNLEKVYAGTTNSFMSNSFSYGGKQFVAFQDQSEEGIYESIYEWKDNQLHAYQTVFITNDLSEYMVPKYFTINGNPFLIELRNYFDMATISFYEWESNEQKDASLSDVICSLNVLAGNQCDYQSDDDVVEMKDVLHLLSEISR